jgi:nucleotide-binding universal stress UspA family protein
VDDASALVLTAVDLEESSARVVEIAFDLAARLGWGIVLVHVLSLPVQGYIELGPERMEELRGRMAEWARTASASSAPRAAARTREIRRRDLRAIESSIRPWS